MNTKKSFKSLSLAVATVIWTAAFAAGVFAQGADTAYVPFLVNVNATVTAVPTAGTASVVSQVQLSATGGVETVLRIPLPKTSGVAFGAQKQANIPAVISNHGGKIALILSEQPYKNAEVALFSVNGKRVLNLKTSASGAVSNISRQNIVAGVYLLSVRGTDGAAFTSRVTHGGGNLDISVAFVGESLPIPAQMAKANAAPIEPIVPTGSYRITVSAAGYVDTSYAFNPVKGTNTRQNITLRSTSNGGGGGGGGTSGANLVYGGQTYKTVVIGGKTWMAENLNYAMSSGSWCYDDKPDSCKKYGRLYDWATAMGGAKSSTANPSGVKGVCPSGWHLPSRQEWDELAEIVGGSKIESNWPSSHHWYDAGKKLKSTSGWLIGEGITINGSGTDDYGFSALPGGYRVPGLGIIDDFYTSGGDMGYWWTTTDVFAEDYPQIAGYKAYTRLITVISQNLLEDETSVGGGLSVRCVRD